MIHLTKPIKFVIIVLLLYSIYIFSTMPTITEGFTGDIRQKIRPRIRKITSFYAKTYKKMYNKMKNIMLKKNR